MAHRDRLGGSVTVPSLASLHRGSASRSSCREVPGRVRTKALKSDMISSAGFQRGPTHPRDPRASCIFLPSTALAELGAAENGLRIPLSP